MKIYVVEVSGDYTYQCGFSLCKSIAEKQAEKLNKRAEKVGGYYKNYWVTEYEIKDNQYVDFD